MKKVLILRGLPGSGKTMYWKHNVVEVVASSTVVSADHYFMEGRVYRFDPTKIGSAHASCFRLYLQALEVGYQMVVVDNTNTTPWEISPYILAAEARAYESEILEFPCDVETAIRRNIHGVGETAIRRMAERMAEPLPPWWKRHVVEVQA